LSNTGEAVSFLTLWYESHEAGKAAAGEYSWVYQQKNGPNDNEQRIYDFYQFQAPKLSKAGGSIYPGFHDFYAEGNAGSTLKRFCN